MKRITIYWRDIPSQVMIKSGRQKAKVLLSHRFQAAIDRAAMRADKGGSEAYLEAWRRVTDNLKTDADLAATAQVAAANLEAQYSDQHLERLVKQKGFEDVTSIDPAQHPA
jgi:hypothetical protein